MNEPKPVVVIYHKADYDGIFCREIARRFFGDKAEYIGWDYGEPEPAKHLDGSQELYILDLSVPSLMDYPKLTWIDHHKSAIEKYPATIRGYRIDGVAACRLAWQWFLMMDQGALDLLPGKSQFVERMVAEPFPVRLAGEWDIWDHRDTRAEILQFGLDTEEHLDWECVFNNYCGYVDRLLRQGEFARSCYRKRDADIMRERSFTLKWEGLTFLCLNTARCNSKTFQSQVRPEHDALLAFYFNGLRWSVSMYGIDGKNIDLSLIAVKYGGGGHRGACGFSCGALPFFHTAGASIVNPKS